jgi:hypothetical protein
MFQDCVKRRVRQTVCADAARLESKSLLSIKAVMKILFSMMAAVILCSACAQGGAGSSSAGSGSITMYGTIDEGIAVHN